MLLARGSIGYAMRASVLTRYMNFFFAVVDKRMRQLERYPLLPSFSSLLSFEGTDDIRGSSLFIHVFILLFLMSTCGRDVVKPR